MTPPTFLYPENCTLVPLRDIDMSGRTRQEFPALEDLAQSIATFGLIHPPTLTHSGNRLIAGECRIRAMQLLSCDLIPVLYREEMSDADVAELELHENIKRHGMTWQEKVLLISDIHNLRVKQNAKLGKIWYQKETGDLLNCSAAHVSHTLLIADALRSANPDVLTAPNAKSALEILIDQAEKDTMKLKATKFGTIVSAPKPTGLSSPIQIDLEALGSKTNLLSESVGTVPEVFEQVEVDLSKMFYRGDCLEIMSKLPKGSVDHVITDIPYGINMDNLDQYKDIALVVDQHDVEENVKMMPEFLKAAYDVLPERGYCVFWYDLDHHEKLQAWATGVGFKVQRWPLVWVKSHPCRNSAAQYNFTKATEVAMVCRKGSDCTMVKPATRNYVIADAQVERKLYDNPFAKPFEVWKFILEHVAFQGQKILDPYAGQMSCPRACVNLGMTPVAIELVEHHYNKGVAMMKELFIEVIGNKVKFVNDPTQ